MWALRDGKPHAGRAAGPGRAPHPAPRVKAERALLCRGCGCPVTSERQRLRVRGQHKHHFMNPAGFLFHIGCFAEATGCRIEGPSSDEYTWFPGMSWRLALCGGCGVHLGWHFRGGPVPAFFALILDRLAAREPGAA